jgi:hypothetical protein
MRAIDSLRPPPWPDLPWLAGAAGMLRKPTSWEEMRGVADEDRLVAMPGTRHDEP